MSLKKKNNNNYISKKSPKISWHLTRLRCSFEAMVDCVWPFNHTSNNCTHAYKVMIASTPQKLLFFAR